MVQVGIDGIIFDHIVWNDYYTEIKNGKITDILIYADFKISPQVQLNMRYSRLDYSSDDGTINFEGDLISSRLKYQISKKLSSFIKFQYDSSRESFLFSEVLISSRLAQLIQEKKNPILWEIMKWRYLNVWNLRCS